MSSPPLHCCVLRAGQSPFSKDSPGHAVVASLSSGDTPLGEKSSGPGTAYAFTYWQLEAK